MTAILPAFLVILYFINGICNIDLINKFKAFDFMEMSDLEDIAKIATAFVWPITILIFIVYVILNIAVSLFIKLYRSVLSWTK